MKSRNILLFAIAIIGLTSCNKYGDFEMNFKATMKSEPLVLIEQYDLGDIQVKFENLTFYITDLALVNDKGEEVSLSDVEFVELKAFDENDAMAGKSFAYNDLEAGTYTKVKWTMGVSDDLNAKSPSDFEVSSPLGRTDHYWGPWESYIFSKTEGNADVNGDGNFDLKFFYHTGSDALSRAFELNEDIVISDGETKRLELSLDYNELLKNADGSYFDIESFPRNHDPNDVEIITQYVNNYVRALTFKK